jgi:hypothetical protein
MGGTMGESMASGLGGEGSPIGMPQPLGGTMRDPLGQTLQVRPPTHTPSHARHVAWGSPSQGRSLQSSHRLEEMVASGEISSQKRQGGDAMSKSELTAAVLAQLEKMEAQVRDVTARPIAPRIGCVFSERARHLV